MAIYNNPPIIPRYAPNHSQNQNQNNIYTYPDINNNTNTPSSRSLTIENAYLHSQLITLQRTLTRQSTQLQAQADIQAQTQAQVQYGQRQMQNRNSISTTFLNDPESVLRAALQDVHAAIREFSEMYAVRDWDGDRRSKGKGDLAFAWSEVPNVLKSGVREISQDNSSSRDRDRNRNQSLPVIMKQTSNSRRRDSKSRSNSNSNSPSNSRADSHSRDRPSNARSSSSLLASLLTREIYLAMWENAFFLADEPNAVRERYRARQEGGRRDDRRKSTGNSGSGEEEMITRSTILADTFRDLWDFSPPQASSWRTQYFSILQQELTSTSSSPNPNTSSTFQPNSSSIHRKISSYATILVSSFLTGSLSPFTQKLSPRDDIMMRKSLHGIICQAARLFVRLRAQRCALVVGDEREVLRERFWVGSMDMVVDGAESGGVDERRCDGGRVDVVVSPVVYVVEEGVDGARRKRVLVKAVVVVGDEF